jgi:putrescine transport system substrate-binding protein
LGFGLKGKIILIFFNDICEHYAMIGSAFGLKEVPMIPILRYFIVCLSCLIGVSQAKEEQKVLNIFAWYASVPQPIIKQFEQETGIKVNLDFFDTNDVLETNLFAGNTGYDIVFPTTWPYLARHVPAGMYQKIDKSKLKNYQNLDPVILQKIDNADPGNLHFIPYFWGLVALGYDKEKVERLIPKEMHDSWALIFDLNNLQKLSPYGVALLDDSVDVFLSFYIYLGLDPFNSSPEQLAQVREELKKRRPFIRRFANSLTTDQLANGELCLIMHWSEFISKARTKFQKLPDKPEIKILLPREGTTMWVDGLAIPKDAKHVDAAHQFIDFLLRAEIAAAITNSVSTPTAVKAAKPLIREEIANNPALFPSDEYMKKVFLPEIRSKQFQRLLTRFFTTVQTSK